MTIMREQTKGMTAPQEPSVVAVVWDCLEIVAKMRSILVSQDETKAPLEPQDPDMTLGNAVTTCERLMGKLRDQLMITAETLADMTRRLRY